MSRVPLLMRDGYPKKLAGIAAGLGKMKLLPMMVISCSSFGKRTLF